MSDLNDRLQQARDRIAQSLLPKVADASKAASESRLDTAPKGSNLREHIANGGIVTNNLVNYFNDDAVAKTIKAREELAAQQNDYVGISTANLRSSNPFVSAAANTANLVGGAVGTLAQWANTAAGDEFTAQAIALEAGTPPQMIEAYNTFNKIRSQKQTLAEEHGILLDMLRNKQGDPVAVKKKLAEVEATYKGIVVDPNVEAALSTQIGDETYLDRLDRSQELRHKGVRVQAGSGEGILPAMNVSDFSNPYFKKPLEEAATSSQFVKDTNKEADAAFDRGDYLEGIGKKALSFGAVVGNVLKEAPSNPMGVLQYTAESAPYFALPGVGTAAIVNQTAVEGRNKFEQRTGNALPTTGENLAMLGTDVLYGALNYLGDKGINNAARGITAGVGRTNTQILRDAATGTGQSTISAVGKEAAAEGAQTYLEDSGQNLSTYFNPETVGLGTAIGGLSAGIVSGPGAVVSGAKQASLDRFMNTEEGKAIADQMELAKVPTEELSDITSPKYNPHEVIRRTTNSVKGEDSVATIKETNLAELDKIGAIVDSLDGAIADAESAQAEYVKTSAMLDQLEANDVDGSKAEMIAAARSTLDESNAQNLSVGYEENIKQLQAKKAKADELYLSVREEIIKSNAYLDSLDFVDGVAVNGKPKAASEDTVTNDYISEASGREAARLAQEPDNDYTEEEVSRLRTFSDAVAAANRRKNLNVVGEDIAQGSGKGASKRFKGLGSYLVDAANLVKSGNDRAKKALLNTLTKFSENHESKVAAVKQAFANAQGTDVTIVGKDATTGKWNILDTVSAEDYKANYEKTLAKTGSLGIHSGSNANGFISSMEQESKDIKAVLASVEDTLTTGKLPVHVIAAQGKPKTTESSKGTTKSSTTSKEEKRNPQMEATYKDVFDKPIGEWDESDFSTIGAQAYDTGSTISTPEEAVKANSFSQKMTKKIIADGIAKNRSTADIMQDVVNVAYSSDFNMKTQGVNALYAYINMRKGLVTEAENKLKGKSTPATKPTAKAPVESKPVLPVIPQEAVENEEVDAAVVPPEQAAQATKAPAGKPKETKPTASTPEPVLKSGESSTRVTPKGYTEVITQLDVYTQEVNVTAKDGMVTTHVTRTTYPDIVSTKVDVGGKKVTVKKSVLIERNLKKGGEVSKVFVFSEDGVIPKKQVLNDLETDADIVNNLAKQDGGKQLYTPAYSDERANTGKGTKATTPKTHFIDYSGDTTTNTEVDVNALLDEANAASFEEEYDNQADIIEGELRGEPTPTEAEPSTPEPTVEDTLTAKLEKAKEDALNELEDLFKEAGKGLKQNADPVLITKIMAATVKLTGIYFALGTIKFADWAKAILTDLKKRGVDPEDAKPLLKQAYLATAASSEVKDEILDQMDDAKTVRAFDIDSLLLGSKDTKEVPKGNGEIKLNEGQEKAFSEIMTFLENTDPSVNTHTLIGAAGTGKTTIVNSILKALREAGSVYGTVVLTSPTHRANTVTMSKNKSEKVQTLHKLLNLLPWIDLDKFSDYDSSKVTFKRGDSEDDTGFPSSGLVIVDESSMIGDDLYDFLIKSLDANPGVKILFLGDAAQLRPVSKKNKNGERVGIKDDAKDSKALTESNSVSILTKVERAENSALLGESVYLRNGKGNFSDTNNMTDSNGVVFLNEKKTFIDKVVDMFKSKEFLKDPLLVRVVAFRNEVIKDLNNRIREGIYGKNPPDYVVGELLLGYNAYGKANPDGILPIANGVDYIIDKIGPTESKEILGVSVLTAEITFHDVFGLAKSKKLRFILPSNTEATWTALGLVGDKFLTHDANGKFIPERDTRARYKRKKPFEEVLGEYVFPRDIGVMEKKKGDTKEKLRPIHNQTINYGYAHTIHKSQGGTYSYVFVEGRDIDSPDADLNKRLRYVGTTRAKKGAFIYVGPGVAIDTSKPVTYLSFTPADAKDKSKVETPIIEETPKTADPILGAYTNHSGGAKGYDAEWDIIGSEFGFNNNNHYLLPVDGDVADPRLKAKGVKPVDATKDIGQVAATGQATGEAQVAVTEAERLMGRIAPNHTTRNTKKIRNYAQVKHADGIFAIGSLIPKGAEITIAQGKETRTALVPQVNGGTSVAVQLGIMMGKPTYVFNQVENGTYAEGWHKWDAAKEDFVPTGIPVLTKNFAGVGTSSNTTEQGKQAIRDVYQKTLDSLNESESKTTGTSIDASNIYDRLNPSKTVTENVALESWSNLKDATEAITDKAVISTRIKGSNEHFGNPFSSTVAGLIKTKSTEESVVRYLDWILSETTDINPEQHAWIREQLKSQALVGKPILYYKELGEPSHANALDYLINTEFKVDPEVATETQTINPEYRGKVILAHAGTGKSFATKSNPDIVDGDVLYYQATNTIIDKYNKANGENVPKIKDVTGTRGVFDAWGEYGDKAAIQALEVLKVNNKNVVGELSKVTPTDVAKWKKSLLGGDSDTKAIATLEKYLVSKTEIDSRKAEAIRRRNEIYQEYAKQARALADSGKTVLSSSIRPELVAVADIVIAQNDVNFIAKNLTSSERVNQNSEVDLGKIQKKIDKAIRVEGELGNKGKRITLKNLGDKQFISDLLFGSDEVIAESVIDEGVSVHGKPKLMSKPIREIDNELPVGGMSVFTGAANVTPRERQAAQAKIINSPNTTETKVVAPIKRKDGSTTPGRTTKIEISGLQKANLVVASFYQKAKSNSVVVAIKDFFTTHFSNDTSANEFLDKFLGRPATPEELNLIRVFRDFHTKRIQPNVRSLLTGYAQLGDFKLTDYLTYLFPDEANPSLDENIVTAISAAAFSFLLEKSGKFTHAEEDVAELLGLDEKTPIPHVVMRRYQNVGSSRAAIVSYLGRSIFETLSLKVQQDATEERKQRMINAFGSLAYNIMAKEGLLQVTEVLNSVVAGDIARVTGQTTDHTVKNDETLKGDHVRGFTTYARVAYDTKTKKSKRGDWLYENNAKLRPDIQEYKDAARGVSSVLNNLFGITNVDTAPLFKEPKGLNQESTDQLGTQVPSALKDNTEQMMKKKYVPNGDTYKAMLHLRDNNTEALEAMIGVVSDEDIAKMHVTQRSSVISTNEGLRRSLENGLAFVSSVPTTEGQYAPIYLPMKVWVLNRVGVTSNLFNEQGDKVHRALTVMSQHVQTIAATQPLVNGEISLVGRALLGAAAYMEEITLSIGKVAVDKTAASVYLPALMEYLSLDRVSSAIASYGKLQDGTATMEDITAVRDLVIEFGGGAMSLASVNVLYQLSTIKDGKATLKTEGEVTTNVAIGSDGVTNGMALSMLVYGIGRPRNKQGATVNSLHNAAGYFYVGDKQETLMAYRSSGADDLYQQLARIQKDLWNTLVTNNRNPVEQAKHAALAFFDPKFGERAGAKVGLVPFVYGSGFTSIKAAQSRAFISSIYATMAKLASSNGGNPTTASIVEFDTHLSALLGKPETFLMNAVLAAREGLTVKEELIKAKVDAILETELTRNMIDKITEVESGIRGTITQNAMKVMSGDLIAARGRVNNLASLGFDIFKGLFDFTRDETLKNLESQGLTKYRVAQNGDRITLEGLTVKQMDRLMADLNKYGPVVVSVAGTYSTNPVESAHAMYIVTKVPQTAELPVSKLHIKTQFDIKHTPNSATVPTFSNFESPLYTITIEYRGPANNASIVQAMDAWVTTQVSSKFDALNHHDENASGVTEAVAMAQFQNKVLFDAALQYGVYKEVLRGSLFRPLRGIIKYGESSTGKETDASSELARRNFAVELSKGTFSSLKQYADENFNIKNKTSYSDLLKAIVTAMYDVEVNKVSALKGLSAISQYSLEGGEYKITPRDKQAIEDKIAALKEELALDLEVATKLGKDLDKLYFSTITTPKAQAKPEVVRTIGSNGRVTQRSTKKIKFRRAGDQSNILNPVYLGNDFLVVNDGIVDVVASIANIDFSGTYMDSVLGNAMLKLILSSLPKGLTVQYLTPDNVTPDMAKALVNPNAKDSAVDKLSRGDSWYYNNNIVIAVDGRGHAVSLIHELVHAVTSATVGIGGDPNTIDAFTRLSDRLKEYAADNAASISPHTLKKIEYATGKLSEFITVMLTEQDVFELARKIPTSLKTRTRSANTKGMATLLKDFLTVIADYFRSKVNAAKDSLNGMESLLESTLVIAMDAIQLNKTYFDSGTSEDFEGELDNDLDNKKADAVRLVTEFRAQEVFEALPSSGDLEADQRLSALMLSIIDSTYTPISNSRANTTYTPNEVWGKAISEGRTPYGTGAIAAGFELSQRELFAIEALEVTVKGVIDSGIVSPAYKELLKVFDTAKTVLSAKDFHKGDWSKATEHQKEVAEAKHRYLFNIAQSANGRSDFMSKFVAMALGSHEVHALLTFSEKKAKAKDSTLLSKIEAMYEHALRWVSGYLTNTSTYQQAKNKLPILVRNLVDIDHKKRDQAVGNVFDKLNVGVGKLDKFLKERGNKLDASLTKLVDGTKYPRIAGVTKTAGIIAGGRAMDLLDLAQQYRDLANPGKPLGWKAEILNEMATPSKAKQAVLHLLRRYTLIQTGRKNHSSTTVEALLESFADGGMKLSKSDKEALTYGVLRTDMQVLFSQYGRIGLRRLLSSPQFLDQRIQELEVDVTDPLHRVRVKDLAFYMTTGETNDMLAENALSIARNVGMQAVMKESEVDPDYLSKLDELISLRALEYMDTHHKDSLIKIMDIENARTEGSANGVETLMRYHKRIQEDAKDALYEGNTTAFVKGYIPDITDPHREIKVVTTEAERKQMKDMGYTFVRAYRSHPSEPGGGTRYVYVTEASSKTRYVSGAVSMTGKVKNGTSIFANSDLSYVGEHNVIRRETDLARERILNINPSSYDPRVDGTRGVAPTYSNGGTIIDFRYVHSHATKDSLLSRNNNFAKVLGAFAGSNFDKVSTSDHNKAVIDVITADYQENYTRYPRSFVEVGPDSPDPRVRAMYFMLPEDTRNYVQSIWGKGTPMYIRNTLLLPLFGTSKYTIGLAFDKNPELRNLPERIITGVFSAVFKDTAKLRALQAETLNQSLVSWYKSTVVIRNLTTLMGNQASNTGILLAMNVPATDIYRNSVLAYRAGMDYMSDTRELIRAQNAMNTGIGNAAVHLQTIRKHSDSLARNPLKEFLDAGMLTTIVEDVSLEINDYEYKSRLEQKIDDQLDKLNPTIRKIGATLLVAPSTELYQKLATLTQLSDFTAKYVLYSHMRNKSEEKLSHEDALALADTIFINYDVPTSMELQYGNDMGFLMFTKYTLRVQRAMAYLIKNHKGGLFAQHLLANTLGMPAATIPLFINQLGNPLQPGGLGAVGALNQPLPIKMLLGGIN